VLYKKGHPTQVSQLKAYLGPSSKHNNYEAEIVGEILATWIIRNTPEMYQKTTYIYTDNQSFIRLAEAPKAAPGQYLLWNFNEGASDVRAKLELRWISGHSKVRGNERADKLAKEVAAGKASRGVDLPPILRNTLPTSISSKNREHMEQLKRRWVTMWQDSPRKPKMERIDDSFPFNGYRKRQHKLSRAHASILMQVRSGHLPLNTYLYRVKKSELNQCEACKINPEDESPPETIKHFLYDCEAYTPQRSTLIRAIGATNLPLKEIMSETKYMKELARYIVKTGRFQRD